MDPDIKTKINDLLHELRSWTRGEERSTVQELAEKFGLTAFVVARIAAAEDVEVANVHTAIDPEAVTRPVGANEAADTTVSGVVKKDDVD